MECVKAGDKIDVLDTEQIWCKATVEMIVKSDSRKDLLYVHYDGWNRKYDEYIYVDSYRIAPQGVYTNRRDIPIYRMIGNRGGDGQLSMMYAVVLNNAQEEARIFEEEERNLEMNNIHNEEDDEEDEPEGDEPDENPIQEPEPLPHPERVEPPV